MENDDPSVIQLWIWCISTLLGKITNLPFPILNNHHKTIRTLQSYLKLLSITIQTEKQLKLYIQNVSLINLQKSYTHIFYGVMFLGQHTCMYCVYICIISFIFWFCLILHCLSILFCCCKIFYKHKRKLI